MKTHIERFLSNLEWSVIIENISARAQSPLGTQKIAAIVPLTSKSDAQRRHRLIAQALILHQEQRWPSGLLSDVSDPSASLERAIKGGVLEASELFQCAHFMGILGKVKDFADAQPTDSPNTPKNDSLAGIFLHAPETPDFAKRILRIMTAGGEILDHASAELARLRKLKVSKKQHLERYMREKVSQWYDDGILQDQFYDTFDGRFVVPIKAGQSGKITGNLFSRSQSRQSLFIEPQEFVIPNNELLGIDNEIRQEEYRILKEYSAQVMPKAEHYLAWVDDIAELDLILASALLAIDWKLAQPNFSTDSTNPSSSVQSENTQLLLPQAFHPLLILQGKTPVRNDVCIAKEKRTILISGPNTGGKTVLIKAVSLACTMAKSGLFIPCDPHLQNELPFYSDLFCLIGDEQNINEGLSSFSAQIKAMKEVLAYNGPRPLLIIVDEILSSTDPEEAAALSQGIIEHLMEQGHHLLITTHFSQLAGRLSENSKVSVAAMEFIAGKPTFRLLPDQLGSSHALEVAAQLGFPMNIIARAQQLVAPERLLYEQALKELEAKELERQQQWQNRQAQLQAEQDQFREQLEEQTLRLRQGYQTRIEELDQQWQITLKQTIQRIQSQVKQQGPLRPARTLQKQAKSESEFTRKKWRSTSATEVDLSVDKEDEQPETRQQPSSLNAAQASQNSLRIGARVRFTGASQKIWGKNLGEIIDIKGSVATLVVGRMKTTAPLDQLSFLDFGVQRKQAIPQKPSQSATNFALSQFSGSAESFHSLASSLDLRGKRLDAAMSEAATFIDRSFRSGKPLIRIISGHGTGAIKNGLKELLAQLTYIKEVRPEKEGNDGAIVIEFDL